MIHPGPKEDYRESKSVGERSSRTKPYESRAYHSEGINWKERNRRGVICKKGSLSGVSFQTDLSFSSTREKLERGFTNCILM
jgi:hypothetical protein